MQWEREEVCVLMWLYLHFEKVTLFVGQRTLRGARVDGRKQLGEYCSSIGER